MSEYAAGHRPTPEHLSFDELDHTGTLFEGRASGTTSIESLDTSPEPAPQVAPDLTPRWHYPEKTAERQSREALLGVLAVAAHQDDEPSGSRAYSELGGGHGQEDAYRRAAGERSKPENLEIILTDYEPWMRDVTLAVERYGLLDMGPDDVERMTQHDREVLSLYVDGYMEGLASIKQLIVQFEGVADRHDFFNKYTTTDKGAPTPEEFNSYLHTLDALSQVIHQQGAADQLVRYAAAEISPVDKQRQAKRKRNKDTKRDTPRVYFDEKGSKYRVELVPLRGDTTPPY